MGREAELQEALERVSVERDEAQARTEALAAENAVLREALVIAVEMRCNCCGDPEFRVLGHAAWCDARAALSTPPHGGLGPEAVAQVVELLDAAQHDLYANERVDVTISIDAIRALLTKAGVR